MLKLLRGGDKVEGININSIDKLDEVALSAFSLCARSRLVVRGLYRYEHAGFRDEFRPGALVTLVREPENAYDPNAVRVILSNGEMLGYIAKDDASTISSELAAGVKYVTRIANEPFKEQHWGQCELDVLYKIPQEAFEELERISRRFPDMSIQYDSQGNVVHVVADKSPLCEAVEDDDVVRAQNILAERIGNVNENTFSIQVKDSNCNFPPGGFSSQPLLLKIRSLEMYKLFVRAGVNLYPESVLWHMCRTREINIGGNNLLKALWEGPQMGDAAVELADYLVFTEYDRLLRSKIDEIRASFNLEDGGPYKNNKAYVLEWCDMEKRAIAAFSNLLGSLHEYGPYSLGHDLTIFLCDWKTEGYDYACGNPEVGEDEIPPRYVYPERILKRGFK